MATNLLYEEAWLSLIRHEQVYQAIKEENEEHGYPISALCKLGSVSRAAYYKWLHREKPAYEAANEYIADEKCIDNGPMEGFWGILKRERYYGNRFTVRDSLVKMIEVYIEYYNTRRLQRKPGILTPFEKHEQYLAAA